MAFRNKNFILNEFKPDIAVFQECENKDVLTKKNCKIPFNSYIWYGNNKNKGIGIMSFHNYKIELLDHNTDFQYILPIKITHKNKEFYLLAIWTQLIDKKIYYSYVVQAAKAFNYYQELLLKDNIIIIGDFNSNAIWDDCSPKEYNHTDMINILKSFDIISVYHSLYYEEQGKEKNPTLYFRKDLNKKYHIDYIFLKENNLKKIQSFKIGKHQDYINYSDHIMTPEI